MRILATIAERAAAEGLPFLVIGGNAVIVYGCGRKTMDLDLLVREDDRRAWDTLITSLGCRPHQIARVFHMYNPIGGRFGYVLQAIRSTSFWSAGEPARASPEYQEILNKYADDTTRRKLAEALPGSFGPESSGI